MREALASARQSAAMVRDLITRKPVNDLEHGTIECTFIAELVCFVERLEYDYRYKKLTLWLHGRNCTAMSGAVAFAERIDPLVQHIYTRSQSPRNCMQYARDGEKWKALQPEAT